MTLMKDILERQRELMIKFEDIEQANKLLEWRGELDNLDSPLQQMKLRRYCWDITEEIGEALDVAWCGDSMLPEVSDAFHYLIELFLISSTIPLNDTLESAFNEAPPYSKPPEQAWLEMLVSLAMFANKLKNRPHKIKLRTVEAPALYRQLQTVLDCFIRACKAEGFTAGQLAAAYFDKATINDQRITDGV